jgi:hypothetical protein
MSTKPPPNTSINPRAKISSSIEELFGEYLDREIALQLLNSWVANLQSTETKLNRDMFLIAGLFAAFLALDTGVFAKLAFQGAEIQRTGLVLLIVPMMIAYLYYRYSTQMSFVHDLRTAISLLYKKLHAPIYYTGLDLFVHVPTVRNLEAYDSFRAPLSMTKFHERTTDIVTILLFLAPLLAMIYCFTRLWKYHDIRLVVWIVAVVISLVFVVRAWLFGVGSRGDDFSLRKRI